jgi:hypothetical protein
MNTPKLKKLVARIRRLPLWAWEISIVATMTVPLLEAVAVLERTTAA